MPLKAKILTPVLPRLAKEVEFSSDQYQRQSLTKAQMSTNAFDINDVKEQPGDNPNDVLFGSHYGVRTIELNRPNKMNSLDSSMARKIILRLKVYLFLLPLLIAYWKPICCRSGKNPSLPTSL